MPQFKLITATDEDDNPVFYIETPDGNETEETESGSIAEFDYDGRTYFATDDASDHPGMEAGVVYALGAAQDTIVEEEQDDDAGEDGDEDEDAVDDGVEPEPET